VHVRRRAEFKHDAIIFKTLGLAPSYMSYKCQLMWQQSPLAVIQQSSMLVVCCCLLSDVEHTASSMDSPRFIRRLLKSHCLGCDSVLTICFPRRRVQMFLLTYLLWILKQTQPTKIYLDVSSEENGTNSSSLLVVFDLIFVINVLPT